MYESKQQTAIRLPKSRTVADEDRMFAEWVRSSGEGDDWLGTPRFLACVMVSKDELDSVLEGPPADEFDADGEGILTLVSTDEDQGYQAVGASYLVPRIYSLLEAPGWDDFATDGVAIP